MIAGLVTLIKGNWRIAQITQRVLPIPAPVDLSLYPLVTFQAVSRTTDYTFDGSIGLASERIVFDCLGTTYKAARSLAEALASLLSGYRGTLADGTRIFETQIATVMDRWDDGSKVSSTQVHVLITYAA